MQEKVLRKLFLGFMQVHILKHAAEEPFFGSWMIEELKRHGYQISAGTLYPMLHSMAQSGLLSVENRVTAGRNRKYYSITSEGQTVLLAAAEKVKELSGVTALLEQ